MPDNVVSLAARGEPVDTIISETNKEIIKELESALTLARDGRLAGVAIVLLDIDLKPQIFSIAYKGEMSLAGSVRYLLYKLNRQLSEDYA